MTINTFPVANGDVLDADTINYLYNGTAINKLIQENALNILINSAGASTTLNDWDDLYPERFTNANGQLNKVNTTNTTSLFNTNLYKNGNGTIENLTETSQTGTTYVLKKTININSKKVSSATNDIRTQNSLETGYCKYQFNYTDATNASVENTTTIVSYANKTYTNPNPNKIVSSIYVYIKQSTFSNVYEINDIVNIPIQDTFIELNPQIITSGAKFFQIYLNKTTAGSGSITADLSLDGGTTYTNVASFNTKNPITSTDGTSMILKLNLNGVGSGNTAEANDVVVLLFY